MNEKFQLNTVCDIEEQKKNADKIVKNKYNCYEIPCSKCPIMKYSNLYDINGCGDHLSHLTSKKE